MDIPMITDGARLPTQALRVSMALASAVAAADDGVKIPPVTPDVSTRKSSTRDRNYRLQASPSLP
jgi:hypothetical protein